MLLYEGALTSAALRPDAGAFAGDVVLEQLLNDDPSRQLRRNRGVVRAREPVDLPRRSQSLPRPAPPSGMPSAPPRDSATRRNSRAGPAK